MPGASRRPLVALAMPPGEEFAAALDDAWRDGAAVLPMDPLAPAVAREQTLAAMQPDAGVDDDCWLACLPWHHIGGLQVLLRARLFDAPVIVHERFDVERVSRESDATLVSLVPTQLLRLLDADVDLTRFRAILLGGAAAPVSLLERATAAGARVVTTYGMSETCGGCIYDGLPLDGVEVRIEADGRVQVRGPVLMSRYRLQPVLTAEVLRDGWFVTSDLGRLAADGRLTVHGRVDDVVVTGGENIVTTDVAAALSEHPRVHEAAVVGVPDAEWGHRLVAVIVAPDPPGLDELRAWCRRTLPPAALPRELLVVDRIPKLASGKPDRLAVQSLADTSPRASQSGDTPSRA